MFFNQNDHFVMFFEAGGIYDCKHIEYSAAVYKSLDSLNGVNITSHLVPGLRRVVREFGRIKMPVYVLCLYNGYCFHIISCNNGHNDLSSLVAVEANK